MEASEVNTLTPTKGPAISFGPPGHAPPITEPLSVNRSSPERPDEFGSCEGDKPVSHADVQSAKSMDQHTFGGREQPTDTVQAQLSSIALAIQTLTQRFEQLTTAVEDVQGTVTNMESRLEHVENEMYEEQYDAEPAEDEPQGPSDEPDELTRMVERKWRIHQRSVGILPPKSLMCLPPDSSLHLMLLKDIQLHLMRRKGLPRIIQCLKAPKHQRRALSRVWKQAETRR